MAFTLGFHIILACLGVGFPAMMLIANYIGLRRKDPVALELAQRWSKVAAVTFAVGAVTGTVLSFEFGLLWPEFTERFGEVFGVLFTIEGIFFFLEAIFLTIYIFGWKRLSGWEALLDRRPGRDLRDRRRLLGGRRQLLDEPAAGLHARRRRRASPTSTRSKVIFNPAVPYEVPHMILAAYLVTCFLVASVYAVGMLRGRRDRHHRLGLLIPLTVGCILAPIQFAVGDTAAREIAKDQPIKFAAMECVQHTHTRRHRVPRRPLHRRRGQGRDRDPGARLVAGRLQHRHRGHRPRHRARPRTGRRPTRCCTGPSTAWSGSDRP